VLDYTNLLNEKENQIVELEKKIQNLEAKLRKASSREVQLENHIVSLTDEVKSKEELINLKHESAVAEVANCIALNEALSRIRKNIEVNRYKLGEAERLIMEGVNIPEVGNFNIKIDAFSEKTLSSRSRTL
jgi:chromosome segregation ATPase